MSYSIVRGRYKSIRAEFQKRINSESEDWNWNENGSAKTDRQTDSREEPRDANDEE